MQHDFPVHLPLFVIQSFIVAFFSEKNSLQKIDVDKLADLYEDRLYLPSGLNKPQEKVDAMREQAQQQDMRQQQLEQTLPAMAGAAKDLASIQQ